MLTIWFTIYYIVRNVRNYSHYKISADNIALILYFAYFLTSLNYIYHFNYDSFKKQNVYLNRLNLKMSKIRKNVPRRKTRNSFQENMLKFFSNYILSKCFSSTTVLNSGGMYVKKRFLQRNKTYPSNG